MIKIATVETDERKLEHYEFATHILIKTRERHYSLSSHSISKTLDPEADVDTDTESNADSADDNVLERNFENSDDESEASVSHCLYRKNP